MSQPLGREGISYLPGEQQPLPGEQQPWHGVGQIEPEPPTPNLDALRWDYVPVRIVCENSYAMPRSLWQRFKVWLRNWVRRNWIDNDPYEDEDKGW
jgi:hypothetical protein